MWDWHRSRHWKQSQKGWSPRHSSTTAQSHRRAYSTTPSPPQYTPTDLLGLHLLLTAHTPEPAKPRLMLTPQPHDLITQQDHKQTPPPTLLRPSLRLTPTTQQQSQGRSSSWPHRGAGLRPMLEPSVEVRAPPSASLRCPSSSLFSSFFPHVTWSDSWEERPGTVRALGLLTRVVGESSKAQPCLPVYLHFNKQKCLFQYVDS